ncbi:MAG: signal recognition particle-docking protein FtsY [Mesorhizobium sp.]
MAFNLIKKVFSFGSKKVEETQADEAGRPVDAAAEAAEAERLAAEQSAREAQEKARLEAEAAQAAREAEEQARLLAEADRIEAEWLEERRREAEEAERLAEAEAVRLAVEEEARRAAEAEAARKLAEEKAEQERLDAEQRARAEAAEREAARLAAEKAAEAVRQAAQDAARQAERDAETRRLAEAEANERAEREAQARKAAEDEAAALAEREAALKADQDRLAAAEREKAEAAEREAALAAEAEASHKLELEKAEQERLAAEAERAAEAAATPAPAAPIAPAERRDGEGKVTVAKTVEKKAEPVASAEPAPKLSWFQRMRDGLSRSTRELSSNITGIFTKRKLDEDTLQDLEDVLIRADLGVETALRVTDTLAATRMGRDVGDVEVRTVMASEIEKVLGPVAVPLELDLSHKPHVILVVGVNGTGKTTTIGKLAAKLTEGGLKVMLAAGDTFRAAAIEQLKIWGERTGSPVIATKLGADAAGLAYDAFEQAKAAGSDVLIIDTAGRLQNRAELMAELEKIVRVLGKLDPEAPHTVLQTVDATTGQNALNQVEIFRNIAGVNGLVMTKLDGTARGGILVAIAAKHRLPVYFIGVGEQIDDLEPFSANEFARAIAGVQ